MAAARTASTRLPDGPSTAGGGEGSGPAAAGAGPRDFKLEREHSAAVPMPPIPVGADPASAGLIDSALSLGARALGMPVAFVSGEAAPSEAGHIAFSASETVLGSNGEPIGRVEALDLVPRGPLLPIERQILRDIASIASSQHGFRTALGRYDHVTLLPNRLQFLHRHAVAEAGIEAVADDDALIVLVTIADARQYNEILRALGHAFADDFVRVAASRIAEVLPAPAELYHVSVLSFAFVVAGGAAAAAPPHPVVDRLVAAFAEPVIVQNIPIASRIGVGVRSFAPCGTPPAEAMRTALAAAQDARRSDRQWALYDRSSDEAHLRGFRLMSDLRKALDEGGQLALHYQPRIDMASGRVDGAEALLRWTHPELGPIPPAEFIPLAETTALMDPLTAMIVDEAARQSRAWRDDALDIKLSVNISPGSLDSTRFADRLADALACHHVPPERFELEFTEGMLTSTAANVQRQIAALRGHGLSIAIDDFGTGYSNMDYLTRLPADVLKIDQCFVRPLDREPRHRLLVRALVDMAHELGYRVVAEGIESAGIYDLVASFGCDEGQGYHMSRPLCAEAFFGFAGPGGSWHGEAAPRIRPA